MPSMPVAPANNSLPASFNPSKVAFCPVSFVPMGDGVFRAVVQLPVTVASITKAAKFTGLDRATIYRLYKTEMITGRQASPGKIEVDMESLLAHIEATKEPDYWTRALRKRYRASV